MVRHGMELDSEAIRQFCGRWRIRRLPVFASVLRDDFRDDRDLDILADCGEDPEWDLLDHQNMKDELCQIVGRRADLLSCYAVETSRNRIRRSHIRSTEESVYAVR